MALLSSGPSNYRSLRTYPSRLRYGVLVYSPNVGEWVFSEDEMRRPTPCAVPFGSATVRRALAAQREEDRPTMDGSKERPKVTAGVDLGDKYSYLCLIETQSGEVIEEGRLRTTPEAFRRRFASE
jgi:hypothetical protein